MRNGPSRASRLVVSHRLIRGALAASVAVAAFGLAAGGCNENKDGGSGGSAVTSSIDVPLVYKPRDTDPTPMVRLAGGAKATVAVAAAVDKRDDVKLIGKNTESSSERPVIGTGGSVAELVTKVVRQQAKSAGLTVPDDASAAGGFTLATEVQTFEVIESGTYKGTVAVNFKLTDSAGKPVYDRAFSGDAGNYGKSKSAENYQETYSDSLKKAVNQLFADADFKAALSGK